MEYGVPRIRKREPASRFLHQRHAPVIAEHESVCSETKWPAAQLVGLLRGEREELRARSHVLLENAGMLSMLRVMQEC